MFWRKNFESDTQLKKVSLAALAVGMGMLFSAPAYNAMAQTARTSRGCDNYWCGAAPVTVLSSPLIIGTPVVPVDPATLPDYDTGLATPIITTLLTGLTYDYIASTITDIAGIAGGISPAGFGGGHSNLNDLVGGMQDALTLVNDLSNLFSGGTPMSLEDVENIITAYDQAWQFYEDTLNETIAELSYRLDVLGMNFWTDDQLRAFLTDGDFTTQYPWLLNSAMALDNCTSISPPAGSNCPLLVCDSFDLFFGCGIGGGGGSDTLTADDNMNNISGGAGDDTIDAAGGNDYVSGGDGNDTIFGGDGIDEIYGDAGNDTIDGGAGIDTLDGGSGIDTASYAASPAGVTVNLTLGTAAADGYGNSDLLTNFENITGSAFDDDLTGSSGANVISGGAGNDTIDGVGGNNTLDGGAGNDSITAGTGNDTITGGGGDDTIDAGSGTNNVDGGAGDDNITSGAGADTIDGGTGHDTIDSGDGNDTINGGDGFDNITAGAGNDVITDGAGNDTVDAGAGADTLIAGAGTDSYFGGTGIDTIDYGAATGSVDINLAVGTVASDGFGASDSITGVENVIGGSSGDTITGDANANVIDGAGGNDTIDAGDGNNTVDGGAGNDNITTGTGTDTIDGGSGSDTVDAGAGNDNVNLGGGNDTMIAGAGNDTVDGGTGTDTMDYSAGTGVTGSIDGTDATLTDGGSTDTISNVENFTLSGNDDSVDMTTTGVTSTGVVDAGAGNDTVAVNGTGANDLSGAGIDGAQLAGSMTGVETVDLTGTAVSGGDTFDISNTDAQGISGGTTLTINVNTGTIGLTDVNVTEAGGALITSDNTVGNTRTVIFDDGTTIIIQG